MPTPTPTEKKLVTAYCHLDEYGSPRFSLLPAIPTPFDAIRSRAAQAGPEPHRAAVLKAAREKREVQKCKTLTDQIRAAEARVAAAERVFERVAAAKKLLETEPESDLANKLRAIEGELEAAEKEKAAAVADLDVIRRLAPPLWPGAANAIHFAVSGVLSPRFLKLLEEEKEARQAVDRAAEKVRAITETAIRDHLLGPLVELQALHRASESYQSDQHKMLEEIRESLIGPPPGDVQPTDPQGRFWKQKAAPAAGPDVAPVPGPVPVPG